MHCIPFISAYMHPFLEGINRVVISLQFANVPEVQQRVSSIFRAIQNETFADSLFLAAL